MPGEATGCARLGRMQMIKQKSKELLTIDYVRICFINKLVHAGNVCAVNKQLLPFNSVGFFWFFND